MSYHHTGNCPRCGAPIYGMSVAASGDLSAPPDPPFAYFTCECRKALPAPVADAEDTGHDSTEHADQVFLARHRAGQGKEPASVERAD